MKSYLLINALFKTIEFRLQSNDRLEITELSIFGSQFKDIDLSSINIEEGKSIPSFVSWLVIAIGVSAIVASTYFSQFSILLQNNLLNAVFFLSSITIALAIICKPIKVIRYISVYSTQVLLKIKSNAINSTTDKFISDLNHAIENAKEEETNKINLKTNARKQYEDHHKNVDNLFNLGLIDEILYNRICNSMQEKVFGKMSQHVNSHNVIYLNK